jgi:hypothetical protein
MAAKMDVFFIMAIIKLSNEMYDKIYFLNNE